MGKASLNAARSSVEVAKKSGSPLVYGAALHDLGSAYKDNLDYPQAEQALMQAIAIWEKLRVGLEDKESYRVSLFETQTATYQNLQKVRIAMGKYPEALEAVEQGRARAFAALLSSKLSSDRLQKYTEPSVKVSQLQQIAREQNLTIVSYSLITSTSINISQPLLGMSELYAWVISPDGKINFRKLDINKWEIENGKSLREVIADLQTRLTRSSGTRIPNPLKPIPADELDDSPDELKELYRLLIQPIAEFLPKNPESQIVFVPHDALFLVPFAALREQSGKYLIEKHTISYAPSIQVLGFTEKLRSSPKGLETLLVGNPKNDLADLPNAENEVKAIAQLFKTKSIIGKDATKTAIVAKMPEAQVIHLATHGIFDDQNGLNSAIALAIDGKESHLLTAANILQLNLKAKLVVLSACNTGKGKITGDGVIGLSRAFILAGTPSIIVSLWNVPDTETGTLMVNFYQNMQNMQINGDRAQALRQAMLVTMREYPHPRNWAAFTLIGARK